MASADVNTFITKMMGLGVTDATVIRALAIGYAESGGRANPPPNHNPNGTTDYGFLQINSAHFSEPVFQKNGWNASTMTDIGKNIDAAQYLSKGWTDWSPWTTFTNNDYLKHVSQATADVQAWNKSKGGNASGDFNPVGAARSAVGNVASVIGNAVGGSVMDWVKGLVGWLNPLATTVGAAVLGLVMVLAGIALIVKTQANADVAKVAKILA